MIVNLVAVLCDEVFLCSHGIILDNEVVIAE